MLLGLHTLNEGIRVVDDNIFPLCTQGKKTGVQNAKKAPQSVLPKAFLEKRSHQISECIQTLLELVNLLGYPIASRLNVLGGVGVHRLEVEENLRSLLVKLVNSRPHRFGVKVRKSLNEVPEFLFLLVQRAKRLVQRITFLAEILFSLFRSVQGGVHLP